MLIYHFTSGGLIILIKELMWLAIFCHFQSFMYTPQKNNVFLKSSHTCHITINEPTFRILALTSSELYNDASLKGFVHEAPSLPEDTPTRWQKWQSQKKMKADLKTAAFLEGQGTNLWWQSTAQHFRDRTLLPILPFHST